MIRCWLLILAAMASFDAAYTVRQLTKYGVEVELNPLIPWLVRRIGMVPGVWLAVSVPSLLYALLGFEWHWILETYVPIRGFLMGLQLSKLRQFRKNICSPQKTRNSSKTNASIPIA